MRNNFNLPEDRPLTRKVVHVALPVRWSLVGQEARGSVEVACTYDIHPQGARLVGSRNVNIGDLVLVERGRNKAICQVVWSADPASTLRGQFTVAMRRREDSVGRRVAANGRGVPASRS